MSSIDMSRLGRGLVSGGIAPKYVGRILSELSAHIQDIKEQCMNDGASYSEAELLAWRKIGSEEAILEEALAKPELKSFTWRFPILVLLIGPTLIYLVNLGLFLLFLFTTASLFPMLMSLEVGSIQSGFVRASFEAMVFSLLHATPLCIAIYIAIFLKRRSIKGYLPVIGIIFMTVISSGWAYEIDWSTLTNAGKMSFNWGYSFLPRYIRGNHDIQNYVQILLTLGLAFATWNAYKPRVTSIQRW